MFKLRFNKWIYYEQRAVTLTREKAAAQQRARASHHFRARQFQLLLLRERNKGLGAGCEKEMGVVEMHKIQGERSALLGLKTLPAESSSWFGSSRRVWSCRGDASRRCLAVLASFAAQMICVSGGGRERQHILFASIQHSAWVPGPAIEVAWI